MDRIFLAPESLIRAVLVALCDNERLHARSLSYLDSLEKLHPPTTSTGATKIQAHTNIHPQPTGSRLLGKRKAPEPPPPQICIQCKRAFFSASNNPHACAFHHGRMDMNPSHQDWAGDDSHKKCHDTDDNREDKPEGFLWSCCGRGGAGPGCTEGEHLAVRADDRSKRPRRLDPDELRIFEGKVLRPNEFVNDSLLDDDSSSDDEPVLGGPVSRGMVSPEVEGGGGDGGDVGSEATERDSGGESE